MATKAKRSTSALRHPEKKWGPFHGRMCAAYSPADLTADEKVTAFLTRLLTATLPMEPRLMHSRGPESAQTFPG